MSKKNTKRHKRKVLRLNYDKLNFSIMRSFDTTSLPARLTGLAGLVYVFTSMSSHKPMIIFKYHGDEVSFDTQTSKIIRRKRMGNIPTNILMDVSKWIEKNKFILLRHWDLLNEYDSADLVYDVNTL